MNTEKKRQLLERLNDDCYLENAIDNIGKNLAENFIRIFPGDDINPGEEKIDFTRKELILAEIEMAENTHKQIAEIYGVSKSYVDVLSMQVEGDKRKN